MCDTRPGVRCSDHPRNKLKSKLVASNRISQEIEVLEKRRKKAKPEEQVAIDAELTALEEKRSKLKGDVEAWEFEYMASPEGLKDLEAAVSNPDLSRLDRLKKEIDFSVAKKRHRWQLDFSKILRKAEDGPKGVDNAIELAKFEKENAELKLEKTVEREVALQEELTEVIKERKQAAAKVKANPTPQNRTQEEKMAARLLFIRAALHKISKMKMLYGLISGDLDKYIKSKGMKITKNLAVGAAVLAVEFFTRPKGQEQPAPAQTV